MELTDRIKGIMDNSNLSPAAFADKLEIQRSAISHVLNGRNKPSLDFVLKLLKAFPDIEASWLLTGEETKPKNKNTSSKIEISSNSKPDPKPADKSKADLANNSDIAINPKRVELPESAKAKENKNVSRIVIFYTDNTFESYFPTE